MKNPKMTFKPINEITETKDYIIQFTGLSKRRLTRRDGEILKLTRTQVQMYNVLRTELLITIQNNSQKQDEKGVYIEISQVELQEIVGCSKKTVITSLKMLEEFSLITRKKQGGQLPDHIYIYDFESIIS